MCAVKVLSALVIGKTLEEIVSDFRGFYRLLTNDGQLRWVSKPSTCQHVKACWQLDPYLLTLHCARLVQRRGSSSSQWPPSSMLSGICGHVQRTRWNFSVDKFFPFFIVFYNFCCFCQKDTIKWSVLYSDTLIYLLICTNVTEPLVNIQISFTPS